MPTSALRTTATGSSNTCALTYTPSLGSEGTHNITASDSDDTDHGVSDASPFVLTVSNRATPTLLSFPTRRSSDLVGTLCTATVTDTGSGGTPSTPTGPVNFHTS